MKLHVIMACHNRRELSVRAASSVQTAAKAAGIPVDFTVFDDGSTDGTEDGLRALNIDLTVLRGDGSAFWAKSMAMAEAALLAREDVKHENDSWILWLNDDVCVDESAFKRATQAGLLSIEPGPLLTTVGVGAMRDPDDHSVTYGGLRKSGLHPLRFKPILPTVFVESIDTFNGNLVLVPVGASRILGGIDGDFSHALADIDYGLRCGRLGIPVVLMPGTFGTCPRNRTEIDTSMLVRWRRFVGPKGGGNLASLTRIVRKRAPFSWPVFVSATYVLWVLRDLKRSISTSGRDDTDEVVYEAKDRSGLDG